MRTSQLNHFLHFCRRFIAQAPGRVGAALELMVTAAGLQGTGILLLVPLLYYLGLEPKTGAVPGIADFLFSDLGLPRNLIVILLCYIALVSLRSLVDRARVLLNLRLELDFVRTLRVELHRALLGAEWKFLLSSRRSDFAHVLTQEVQNAGNAAMLALNMAAAIVGLVAMLAIAFRLSWPATLLACVFGLIFARFSRNAASAVRKTGVEYVGRAGRLYALIMEQLAGLAEIRSYGAEQRSALHFESNLRGRDDARIHFTRNQSAATLRLTIASAATLSLLVLIAVRVEHIAPSDLVMLIVVFSRIMPHASQVQSSALQLIHTIPSFNTMDTMLVRAREAAEPLVTGGAPILRGDIVFNAVSYSYREDRHGLRDATFVIPALQMTAIVGPSGAGKSTAALLLMGILPPTGGEILVDGVNLAGANRQAWRAQIGYVPQETFLLHDTLRANLIFARPTASDDELWAVLAAAAAHDFVRALPDGLDTIIGDRGARLSGGERQRIALARALLVQPQLLVLDEATSALDEENQQRILNALQRLRGQLTAVIITHRPSAVSKADHIVNLDRGRVNDGAPLSAAFIYV